MHTFLKVDIKVDDAFIEKFAKRYVAERTECVTSVSSISTTFLFNSTGFATTDLEKIIKKNVVADDIKREAGFTPAVLNDIYRSDLGELLMTYYFEEKLEENKRFVVPIKNISYRELSHLPGRGMDAIGYREESNKINILLGEAKVSESLASPPSVVHSSDDSIYKTQLNRRENKAEIIKKLTDFYRRLDNKDATIIGMAIWAMEKDLDDKYEITFGCTLVRDYHCVNEATDFGKLRSDFRKFERHYVSFSLLSFVGRTISETVNLFYQKVKALAA
jgi:hypothetical protein